MYILWIFTNENVSHTETYNKLKLGFYRVMINRFGLQYHYLVEVKSL